MSWGWSEQWDYTHVGYEGTMLNVTHVITGLNTGGAETMLVNVLSRTDRTRFTPSVISLTDLGPLADRIRALDVEVEAIGMPRGMPDLKGLLRLARRLRERRPHAVQTWMYHANLVGGLAARLAGNLPVAWGIHHTSLEPGGLKPMTIRIAKAAAWVSRLVPDRIVCCAEAAVRVHAAIGYAPERLMTIPNGFDTARFHPDPQARAGVRQELAIPEVAPVIGLVGRYDPQKDHPNFALAAGVLAKRLPEVCFVLCGDGITRDNAELVAMLEEAGVLERCRLLGRREDVPRLQASFDLATSSSWGEAFPLAVGEAMASGVPCVVTDVGDSALLVGTTGLAVPAKNPEALAGAWEALLAEGEGRLRERGEQARRRIEEHFSLEHVTRRYEALYEELARGRRIKGLFSLSFGG